jgi:hypothetical protein
MRGNLSLDRKRGRWKSTVRQRVAWLLAHRDLWKKDKRTIVEAMREAGLVARTTYWKDVHVEALFRLAGDILPHD